MPGLQGPGLLVETSQTSTLRDFRMVRPVVMVQFWFQPLSGTIAHSIDGRHSAFKSSGKLLNSVYYMFHIQRCIF